jgi:hypothetical protein
MKSLIVNYLNSRRSVHIQETIVDAAENDHELSFTKHHTAVPSSSFPTSQSEPMSLQAASSRNSAFVLSDLNLKFIDDNDTDSVLSVSSHTKIGDVDDVDSWRAAELVMGNSDCK